MRPTLPEGYNHEAYTKGWTASLRATGSGTLDNADSRREPNEWYDGYYDAAVGREKWHRPTCPNHHNQEGGCGEA
jgi:hypothetical protein